MLDDDGPPGDDDGPPGDDDGGPETAYPEPDPEADLPDPEADLPSVPSVDVPSPPSPGGDVPGELQAAFWTTVLVFNVAVLTTSVGAMMVAFDVERPLGAGLVVVGIASLYRGYRKYRELAERQREGGWGAGATDEQPADQSSERNG